MARAQTGNGKMAEPTTEDLAAQIELLKTDISNLTSTLGEYGKAKADTLADAARGKVDDAAQKGKEHADALKAHADDLQKQTHAFVLNQPTTALGIAAGVGFLLGFMSSRR
ncbi:DUF883 family protein [Litoreibacter roseus]|uniref:DUF883 domain-containing protein n=1 Tax=Litoreibacter roseus TaxID=2601869 RepID=A0A6N6JJT0_9RHOB|nr:DUF883 family protein [Litoreibacter roseus]GFE66110.1 hypothetical protein KIN_31840 [Litoreibacter roseus]